MPEYNFYEYVGYVLSLHRDELKKEIKDHELLGMSSSVAYFEEELKELEQVYKETCSRMAVAMQ